MGSISTLIYTSELILCTTITFMLVRLSWAWNILNITVTSVSHSITEEGESKIVYFVFSGSRTKLSKRGIAAYNFK